MTRHNPIILFTALSMASVAAISFMLVHILNAPPLYAYLASISITTFFVYGFDKYQAIRRHSRIPEITLHLLALAGGSAAALLAQKAFRHKTRKRSFKIIFLLILLIQLTLIAGILWQSGFRLN